MLSILKLQDLSGQVRKIAEFLKVPFTEKLLQEVTEQCTFKNMKKEKTENISEYSKTLSKDGSEIYYRKGKLLLFIIILTQPSLRGYIGIIVSV